jgi:cation diffusion facilitator family transporter
MHEKADQSSTERDPTGRGERFFRLNLFLKGLLAVTKVAAGLATGSGALIADGWHNLADMLTGIVAWLGFRYALRPPDADHHYGHGNAEALAGTFVGLVLVLAGGGVLWQAWFVRAVVQTGVPGFIALAVAVVSILVNEVLARTSFRLGAELRSQGLVALGRDSRADALSSFLAVLGIVGSLVESSWAEPLVTAGIGVWIIIMGVRSMMEGLSVLMDRVPDPELRDRIAGLAAAVEGVVGVQEVRVHPLGTHYRVDTQISVKGSLTVEEGHAIAHQVEDAVRKDVEEVTEVHVHVNPE